MSVAQRGVVSRKGVLGSLRSQFDFDAPGLAVRDRLERLEYAAMQAAEQCPDEVGLQELEFALEECRQLLRMGELEGESAEEARIGQRMARVRRVVVYYEGTITRLNRRFWWLPCTVGLLVLACCFAQYVLSL